MMAQAIQERGPKKGYDFPEKQAYRETVWGHFAENVPDVSKAKVLFLPGKEGLEIPIALGLGFKEENLIACDDNPALIAAASWRRQYPAIRCYGSSLIRTVDRIRTDRIKIDAANLDFCSNLSTAVLVSVHQLLMGGIVKQSCLLAITVLKGREGAALAAIARLAFHDEGNCVDRVAVMEHYIANMQPYLVRLIAKGEYRSQTQSMIWGVMGVGSKEWVLDEWERFWASRLSRIEELESLDERITSDTINSTTFHALQEEFIGKQNALKDEEKSWWDSFTAGFRGAGRFLYDERPSVWRAHQSLRRGKRRFNGPTAGPEEVTRLREELALAKQRLVHSAAEKAQILQDRGAWR
jgi:hypothetical protein